LLGFVVKPHPKRSDELEHSTLSKGDEGRPVSAQGRASSSAMAERHADLVNASTLAAVRKTGVDSRVVMGYAEFAAADLGCKSPALFRALSAKNRNASSGSSSEHGFNPALTQTGSASRQAWRHPMNRLRLEALAQDCLTQDTTGSDQWQRELRLPFNTDSPAWARSGQERDAAEERMTQLVKTLESEVIPRLLQAHRIVPHGLLPQVSLCPPPTELEVQAFVQSVLGRDDVPVSTCIAEIRRKGMSVEMVYLDLLAPAAKHLGHLWEEDLCDFTEVTVGLGRLQHLLQELSPAFGAEVQFPANARRVLLMPAPGDQHTFGLSMVAEFFNRAGWEVASGDITSPTNAVDMARLEWFDVIGFSVGSETRLDWLRDCIRFVRQVSRNKNIGVMVGGPVFSEHPEYVETVGADCTATDGKEAPLRAEELIGKRVASR
jgi:methanogenic corrinoid protein MtbC1